MTLSSRKTRWMYLACGLISAAGAAVFLWLILIVQDIIRIDAELSAHARAIYLYILGAAVPCLGAVGILAGVIHEIGQERAFTWKNACLMRGIAGMAFLECAYILAGVVGWCMVGLMHPGVLLMALMLILLGAGIGILAWSLAGLVKKASDIQQENDLTV